MDCSTQRSIAVFGPIPPALTGAAMCTGAIVDALENAGLRTQVYPLRGLARGVISRTVIRTTDAVRRARDILVRRPGAAYFSLEGNVGKAFSIPLIALCARLGVPVFIHHHGYSYVRSDAVLVKGLVRLAPGATHIFQCRAMAEEFAERYGSLPPSQTLSLTNAFLVNHDRPVREGRRCDGIALGFMSGSHPVEKGLWEAVGVATALAGRTSVELHVAGPLSERLRAELKDEAARRGFILELYGPITRDKPRFFAQIDAFLFPTKYRNETQGIVNLEAMAHGTLVVAVGQCCIRDTVAPFGGLVFSSAQEFVASAPDAIWGLRDQTDLDPQRQFADQLARSRSELDMLVGKIAASTVRRID